MDLAQLEEEGTLLDENRSIPLSTVHNQAFREDEIFLANIHQVEFAESIIPLMGGDPTVCSSQCHLPAVTVTHWPVMLRSNLRPANKTEGSRGVVRPLGGFADEILMVDQLLPLCHTGSIILPSHAALISNFPVQNKSSDVDIYDPYTFIETHDPSGTTKKWGLPYPPVATLANLAAFGGDARFNLAEALDLLNDLRGVAILSSRPSTVQEVISGCPTPNVRGDQNG